MPAEHRIQNEYENNALVAQLVRAVSVSNSQVACSNHARRSMDKLFIVIRKDLPMGLRCAQIAHAAIKFAHDHRPIETAWYFGSNNIVILDIADEPELRALLATADLAGLATSGFEEPDLGGQMTAAAFEPRARRLLRKLTPACAEAKKERGQPLSHPQNPTSISA